MIILGIGFAVILTLVVAFIVMRSVLHKELANVPDSAETLLGRASVLLHQIRVLAAANIVAFLVLGTLSIIAFSRLGDTNHEFTDLNRAAICDLYYQFDRQPPDALKCAGKSVKENP